MQTTGGDDVMGSEGIPPIIEGDAQLGAEQMEEEVPRINVEIPRCVAQLGTELHFVKLPNFLSVETRYATAQQFKEALQFCPPSVHLLLSYV